MTQRTEVNKLQHLIDVAQRRREQLAAELAELDSFIRTARRLTASLPTQDAEPAAHTAVGPAEEAITRDVGRTRVAPKKDKKKDVQNARLPRRTAIRKVSSPRGSPVVQETAKAVTGIIQEANRPVRLDELTHRLQERGLHIGGKNPSQTLYARLLKAPGLKYVRPDGWSILVAGADRVS